MSGKDIDKLKFKELSRKAKVYICSWLVIFIPLAIWVYEQEPLKNINWLDFFVFLTLAVFFSLKPLTTFRGVGSFDISTIIWVASILLFRPEVVVLLIFLSNLIADIIDRKESWRLALNLTTWSVIYFLAATSYHFFKADQPYYENLLVNLPAFLIVIFILTGIIVLSYSLSFSFINNKSIGQNLKVLTRGMLMYEFSQYPVGILLAMVYHYQRFGLVLFILPFLLFYFSHNYQIKLEAKEQEVIRDPLTSLYNRRYLSQKLREFCSKENLRHFSLVMFDLDNFKQLNDEFGHVQGDKVLITMAKTTLASVREKDIVFRYGGEEFSVVLPDTPKKLALKIAERLRSDIERAYTPAKGFNITASIGVASYPADAKNAIDLIKTADAALYKAKQEGKNKVIAA